MLKIKGIKFAVLVLVLAGLGFWRDAGQRELHVCSRGCPFSSIQAAIDAASSGDIIQVDPGEYKESLAINKSVVLQGARPDFVERVKELWDKPQELIAFREREEVAILGPETLTGPVISVQKADVTISGFTITKAYAPPHEISLSNHGIMVQTGAHVVIENSVIYGTEGGGILIDSVIASISNVIVTRNINKGIHVRGASQVTIADSWIVEHDPGPAIFLDDSSQVLFLKNKVANNTTWCIIIGGSAQVRIRGNQILQNHIGIDIYGEGSQVQILDNQFYNNTDGIRVEYGQAIIQNNRFEGQEEAGVWVISQARLIENTVSKNKGDGILISDNAQVEAVKNEVVGNEGWGIVISGPSCDGYPFSFKGGIVGRENEIHDNTKGDLCPPDYPWPEGFVREEG